jgi:hypothetical protein
VLPAGAERYLAVQRDLLQQMRAILSLLTEQGRQDLIGYVSRYLDVISTQFPL